MSESKGKIIFAILAVLLLLFGGGVTLYPFLNGLWVEHTMHKDAENFLLLLEDSPEERRPLCQKVREKSYLPFWLCCFYCSAAVSRCIPS